MIDELKAKYAKMTPGEWFADDESWCAYALDEEGEPVYLFEVQGEAASNFEADLPGIVALHNAFPVLVERYEAMRVALEEAEWNQLDEHGNWMCPVCDRLRDDSRKHSPKCSIGLALALVAKPLTEPGT